MSKDEMKEVFGEVLMVVGKSKESRENQEITFSERFN